MGKYLTPDDVVIEKLDPPLSNFLKNEKGEKEVIYYRYVVEVRFGSSVRSGKCRDAAEVIETINYLSKYYVPTPDEVTGGGKYSCD